LWQAFNYHEIVLKYRMVGKDKRYDHVLQNNSDEEKSRDASLFQYAVTRAIINCRAISIMTYYARN